MSMKLYCFGESGNSYKAALTLQLADVDWDPVYVDFFNGEARSAEYRQNINAMGEVPVLVDAQMRLSQSGAIQQYVVDKTGKLGGNAQDRYDVLRWVLWDNHKLSSQAGTVRFLLNFLPEDKRASVAPAITFLQGRLAAGLCCAGRTSGRTGLDRRHRCDRGGPELLRVSLLSRTFRVQPGGLAACRCLARPHRRAAALETPVRVDARVSGGPGLNDAA